MVCWYDWLHGNALLRMKWCDSAVVLGEALNFAAYAYAPAILVTPLGALSIIFSSVLAHFILKEELHMFGIVGCILCLVGSVTIVLHAPFERDIESVRQVWHLATDPGNSASASQSCITCQLSSKCCLFFYLTLGLTGFIAYSLIVVALVAILIFVYVPRYGQTHMVVYIGICSLMGSLTVSSFLSIILSTTLVYAPRYKHSFLTRKVILLCRLWPWKRLQLLWSLPFLGRISSYTSRLGFSLS